jgi:hypothetical protein
MFSRQTVSALAQVLNALYPETVAGLVYKHLGIDRNHFKHGLRGTIELLEYGEGNELAALVREIVENRVPVGADAPTEYVFDERHTDLERWLLHDGWAVEDGALVRIGAAIEDVIEVRDAVLEELERTGIDADKEVAGLIEQSARALHGDPPDFNASGTNARIALETVVRRLADRQARVRGEQPPRDRWGDALRYLRMTGFLTQDEEETLAALYTFVSGAAHTPLSDEEWARVARAFMLSSCYYLLKKA